MKKIIIVFLMLFNVFLLTSCHEKDDAHMALMEIKVYDASGSEVVGEWKTWDYEQDLAVAPIIYIYYVPAKLNNSYVVEFYFYSDNEYEMEKYWMTYNNISSYADEYYPEYDGEYYVSRITIDSLTEDRLIWDPFRWSDGEVHHNFTYYLERTSLQFVIDKQVESL